MGYQPRIGDAVRVTRRLADGEVFGFVHGYVRMIDAAFQSPTVSVILAEFEHPNGDRNELCGNGWYSVSDCERNDS